MPRVKTDFMNDAHELMWKAQRQFDDASVEYNPLEHNWLFQAWRGESTYEFHVGRVFDVEQALKDMDQKLR